MLKSPIISVDLTKNTATIKVDAVDVGISGFIVHKLSDENSVILKNTTVISYDKDTKIATLQLSDYTDLDYTNLPHGKWKVSIGDVAELAFAYSRGILIAPNEEIYYSITRAIPTIQWIHPDIFATMLSLNGHPTPLKSDFDDMIKSTSIGLVFIYLDKKVFTLDAKSFKILKISNAPVVQHSTILPFYMRLKEIDASWWGEGSSKLKAYTPYYYMLLKKYNPKNQELLEILKTKKLK